MNPITSPSPERPSVRLTKIKDWVMPVDAESYKILRDHGLPCVRIHENLMPTVRILTRKHKIRSDFVDFQESIMRPALDKLGTAWLKRDHRTASLTATVLKFETTHASVREQGALALPKIEGTLRRLFQRWGYTAAFETSEKRGKLKLHVTYKYDSSKSPIIPLTEVQEALPQIKLELGYVRIVLTLGEREVETNVSIAQGSGWLSMHTSRCLYSQISDIRPFVTALITVQDKDPHNSDNRPK